MKPIGFYEANGSLLGGPGERFGTTRDVGDLPVYRDGLHIISCWSGTWRDRLRFLLTGRVWLWVVAPTTHAPIAIETKSPWTAERRGEGG